MCQCDELATVSPKCDPLKPHKEHPTDCHIFYHCEDSLNGPKLIEKTCGAMYFNPVTMVCDWPYNVEEIKPECKIATSPKTEEEKSKILATVEPIEAEIAG